MMCNKNPCRRAIIAENTVLLQAYEHVGFACKLKGYYSV